MTNNRMWRRLAVTFALAGGMFLAVGTARADRNDDCRRRLEADRTRIDRDASRFGNESHQVRSDTDKMEKDRQWCRDHKANWDHDRFDIGVYLHK
jgi:hypothetical protein